MNHRLTLLCMSGLLLFCTRMDIPSLQNGSWTDLTHEYSEETIYWPTADTFHLDTVFVGRTPGGFYYEAFNFRTAEHGGTHLDAPIHFAEGRKSVEELDLNRLTGMASVIDLSARTAKNRNYQITVEDIREWEQQHGTIPDGSILLFNMGMARFWPDAEAYLGTSKRGMEALSELSFPGIHPETAQWLVDNRNIKAVGMDTPSIDYGGSTTFESHQILYRQNIPGFENVANLDQLPPTGAYVVAFPMKIKNGSGAPLRIAAWTGH